MTETKVAGRYAKSLLGLAIERKIEKRLHDDMQLISNTITANRELSILLKNPVINSDKKDSILEAIFGSKIDAVTLAFLKIITRKKREYYIEDIARQFVKIYKTHMGINTATVTTAVKLDDKLRAEVLAVVKSVSKGEVELTEKINKDIIGGFVLQMQDKQYDASIASKLIALKKDLKINLYVKNY